MEAAHIVGANFLKHVSEIFFQPPLGIDIHPSTMALNTLNLWMPRKPWGCKLGVPVRSLTLFSINRSESPEARPESSSQRASVRVRLAGTSLACL